MNLHVFLAGVMVWLVRCVEGTTYHYQATVWSGTSLAIESSSQWAIRARVTLEQHLVQISHAEVSVYNGLSAREHYYVPVPVEASQLEQPFKLHYEEGRLVGLSVVSGEDVWAVNMKRGLATLLHFDHQALQSPVHMAEEKLLYGSCTTEYHSFPQDNVTVIRKFVNHEMCSEFTLKTFGQTAPVLCSRNLQSSVSWSSDTTYKARTLNGTVELQSVFATSSNLYHLLMSRDSHAIIVNQSLEKETEEKPGPSIQVLENMTQVGIAFELPSRDASQGREPISQEFVYNKVVDILSELSRDLDHLQVGADPDEHHKNLVVSLTDVLWLADLATLQELFSSLNLGTSYQQETTRNIFLDILPKVGSHESALAMRDLIMNEKVRNTTAIHFLTHLPFHIREPSEALLADMQVLLQATKDFNDDLKVAVVLSFANMVQKICKSACKAETLDFYIRYFLDHFTGSKTYQEQLLYLNALSNIDIGQVFDYLVSVVHGNEALSSDYPHHLRYRALLAVASRASFHPQKVRELCWPLLMNQSESLDMRVAALTTLTISHPGQFLNLFSYMQSEADPHLYYHYYTTLQSLADSTFPCYKDLGSLARKVLPLARKPVVALWGSGNYILDFSDPSLQFGSIAHLQLVANKRTGLPNILHLFLATHTSNYITSWTELFVRMEGVEAVLKQKKMQLLQSTTSIPELMDMLYKLDIAPVSAEPLHIELALNLNGSTVLSHYTNASNWKEFVNELKSLIATQLGAHVNYQESHIMVVNGHYFPTSAGTLALVQTKAVGLVSLRGDVAWQQNSLQTDMDINVLHSSVYEVMTFNPILSLWQTVETHHTVRSHLVINNRLDVLVPVGFNLTVYLPTGSGAGLVWHKRTRITMKGQDDGRSLRSLCPTCKEAVDVITGNKDKKSKQLLNIPILDVGTKLQVHVLKCDTHPQDGSIISAVLSALDRTNKNYRILPPSRLYLTLLHFATRMLLAPPEDIAGYSIQIVSTHNQLTKLELSTKMDARHFLETNGKGPIHLSTTLAHSLMQSDTPLWTREMTAVLSMPPQLDSYYVHAKILKTVTGKPEYSVCVELETELVEARNTLSVGSLLSNVLKSRSKVSWGRVNDTLSCPHGGRLDITVTAQASDEQKELATEGAQWPYSACHADAEETASNEGDRLFLDPACSQVISALSTPRKVTAVIQYGEEQNDHTTDSLLASAAGTHRNQLVVTAEFSISRNEMELAINGNHMSYGAGAATALSLLSNTLLPATDNLMSNWIQTCVINSSNVRTFDKAFVEARLPDCYVVGTAEYTQDPTYAIMLRTFSGTNQLALKIYVGVNYIEIISRNGCTTISVNDELVNAQEEMKITKGFGLSINKKGTIEIVAPPAIVAYKITSVTITMSPLLQGHLLGLCGDYNTDPSNDQAVDSFTLACPLE